MPSRSIVENYFNISVWRAGRGLPSSHSVTSQVPLARASFVPCLASQAVGYCGPEPAVAGAVSELAKRGRNHVFARVAVGLLENIKGTHPSLHYPARRTREPLITCVKGSHSREHARVCSRPATAKESGSAIRRAAKADRSTSPRRVIPMKIPRTRNTPKT